MCLGNKNNNIGSICILLLSEIYYLYFPVESKMPRFVQIPSEQKTVAFLTEKNEISPSLQNRTSYTHAYLHTIGVSGKGTIWENEA